MAVKTLPLLLFTCIVLFLGMNAYYIGDLLEAHHKLDKSVLQPLVDAFNQWHNENSDNHKVEVRIKEDGTLGVFAKEKISTGEVYIRYHKDNTLNLNQIYKTFIGDFVLELEKKFGFNYYAHFIFFILHEIKLGNKSKFYPFLSKFDHNSIRPSPEKAYSTKF